MIIACFNVSFLSAQLEISEISNDGTVEIVNTSDNAVDVSNYWLCNRPAYSRFNTLNIELSLIHI